METTTNLQIRINKEIVNRAKEISAAMGLDLTTAIRMFLCQMIHDKRLPFNPNLDSIYANNVAKIKEGLE